MGFLLLWIEALAVSLVFMAWVMACVGRWKRPWLRAMVWLPAALALLTPCAFAVLFNGIMKFAFFPSYPWFYYSLSWAIAFLAGMAVLRRKALKRTGNADVPTIAAQWPRGKLFAIGCVVFALHVATVGNLDYAVCRQVETIRETNENILRAAVPRRASEKEDAFPIYEEAAEAFQCWMGRQQDWMAEQVVSFDSKNPELNKFVQERERAVRLLHIAAKRPAFVVPVDPCNPGFIKPCPVVNVLRPLATFLTLHCRYNLANGNRRGAWQDVETLFHMAEHVGNGRWVNNRTAGWAIERWAIRSLQYVFSEFLPTNEELAELNLDEWSSWRRRERELFPIEERFLLQTVMEAAVQHGVHGIADYGIRLPPGFAILVNSPWYRIFFFPTDLAMHRRIVEETQGALSRPYYDVLESPPVEDFDVLCDPREVGAMVTGESHFGQYVTELPEVCAKADARRMTAQIALAVARFHSKYGRLPENLDALVPDFLTVVPKDPFDGKPMKYEKTDAGVAIYSIGCDMADDGSTLNHRKEDLDGHDMTFEIPRWNP